MALLKDKLEKLISNPLLNRRQGLVCYKVNPCPSTKSTFADKQWAGQPSKTATLQSIDSIIGLYNETDPRNYLNQGFKCYAVT